MIGPYNISDYPITIVVVPLINIVVPLLPPYFYYCAPIESLYCYFCGFILLLLGRLGYIVTPLTPIYRKEVLTFVSSKSCSFM